MSEMSKSQQKELKKLAAGSGTIKLSQQAGLVTTFNELAENGYVSSEDNGDGTTTFTLTEAGQIAAKGSRAATNEDVDPTTVAVPDSNRVRYLNFSGYADTGFRTMNREEAKVHAESLRDEGQSAVLVRLTKGAFGVWSKAGSGKSSGGSASTLVKRANKVLADASVDESVKADVRKALEDLKTAVEVAEA